MATTDQTSPRNVIGRLRMCVPPVLACVADVVMTLRGQTAAYWTKGFRNAGEFNPAARALLDIHPAAFIAAAGVSCLIVSLTPFGLGSHPLFFGR